MFRTFRMLSIFVVASLASHHAKAQQGFFARFDQRVANTLLNQPHWATALVTTNPRVEQGLRSDFVRQTAPAGSTTWNYGNTKGLQFIPLPRTEFRISPPPFFTHSDPRAINGFGDIGFRVKTRLYGSNEEHHNAIATVELGATIPTGKNGNGSCCAIVTPALELGKGFGKLALTSSASGALPASNTFKLGRSIAFNNAIEYRVTKLLWVETEFNSTFYRGGKNDGKQQTFATPGVIVSRIPLTRNRPSTNPPVQPLALTLGIGEQIALTHFNTYNHAPIFTFRLRF